MAGSIHSQAIVSSKALLAEGVVVGPYAVIGDNVKIGRNTIIDAGAQVLGYTEIGEGCHIFPYAVIGNAPQDLKYKGEKSFLKIGEGNIIREFVTINPGTKENSQTIIGNGNLIMAYSHIAHDCVVGNNNVFANGATLAGHVEVGDRVVIGGLVAIHQFCRIGSYSVIGGCSKVVQDIPPFSMCDGHPARVYGINLVGLRRGNFSRDKINSLKKVFKILFFEQHSFSVAQVKIREEIPACEEIDYLLKFIASSKRGISR